MNDKKQIKEEPNKIYNIEFLRFLFTVIILYFHILHANIIPYTGEQQKYLELQDLSKWASVAVQCFLVIGGFFLYQSEKRRAQESFIDTFLDKLARLWPVFAFYVLISLCFFNMKWESALYQLTFLHCTGISLEYKGIIWYIAPYFWSIILISAILRFFSKRKAVLIISLIAYVGYAMNINYTHGGFGRDIAFTFVSLGFVTTLSGVALGVLIAVLLEGIRSRFPSWKKPLILTIVSTAIEIAALFLLVKKMTLGKGSLSNAFTLVILFSCLFVSFLCGRGLLGRLVNRPFWGVLGRYSYSIYVMQQISFYIMARTFWKNTFFLREHVFLSLLFSVVFSVIIGIGTYYLVEKPFHHFYKALRKR